LRVKLAALVTVPTGTAALVTLTGAVPAPLGTVAFSFVADAYVTAAAGASPKLTLELGTKPTPEIVTTLPGRAAAGLGRRQRACDDPHRQACRVARTRAGAHAWCGHVIVGCNRPCKQGKCRPAAHLSFARVNLPERRRAGSSSAQRAQAAAARAGREQLRRAHRILSEARGHLTRRLLRLVGFVVFAYLVLKLIPGLESALDSLQGVSATWLVGAMAVEALSQTGFVVSWRGILDPDDLLRQRAPGKRLGMRIAWAQLGGGMLVPGGTLGSMGIGAWMLYRLGVPTDRVAERQFVLMFLNTGVDALAVVFFGVGLWLGVFDGESSPALTLLPAALVAVAIAAALFVARRAELFAQRLTTRRPKVAGAIRTLAVAVSGVQRMLRHRGSGTIVLGAIAYLGLDMLVLWGAFQAIGADPLPTFGVVAMCYLIGGLAGSIPLPANLGAVTGMAGMLIVFGVNHNDALAAVVLYQAIGFLVPLIGGAIAYLFLRRELGSMHPAEGEAQVAAG
jgi:uncharacterized membrane protein YbhN (UPF0104 family)